VINVVDASNLERNLYLTIQIIETDAPLIILLNMGDVAERRGVHIDADKFSQKLNGIPVVQAIAKRKIGIEDLKEAILAFGNVVQAIAKRKIGIEDLKEAILAFGNQLDGEIKTQMADEKVRT
jgi:ferrous iron transport protein B